jgi:hypothetical protein
VKPVAHWAPDNGRHVGKRGLKTGDGKPPPVRFDRDGMIRVEDTGRLVAAVATVRHAFDPVVEGHALPGDVRDGEDGSLPEGIHRILFSRLPTFMSQVGHSAPV